MPALPCLLAFQAIGSVVAPLEHCLVGLCTYLKRKRGYVKNLRENLEKLNSQVSDLQAKERDVREIIQEHVDRNATNECSLWLSNVQEKRPQQALQDLTTRHEKINKCCCGYYPFLPLLKLGKDIVKETEKIDELISKAIPRDKVIAPAAPPESYVSRHAHPIDDLPSLNQNVKTIEWFLADDKINRLCIYGLPGVGKTTVMKNLHDKVGQRDKFEIICWVTMTEKGGVTCVEAIQRVLEERLGLKAEGRSTSARADQISTQLERKKSYLLFLDQVTPDLDFKLEDVGIYDDQKHGKVVFACDSARIHCFPRTDMDFRIEKLSEEDGRHLFKKIVTEDILRNEEINGVAKSLVRECGGLPKLINVMARKLREKYEIAVWRDTLHKLQNPGSEPTHDLKVYTVFFKLAYDTMEETVQHCLLYWEIFPSGHEIHRDYIIECWRTEDLLTQGESFGQTRDSGHGILTEFIDTGILDRGTKARHYKMYGPFRLVAKLLAKKCNRGSHGHRPLVRPSEEWTNAERVSYICQRVTTLPEDPKCSGVRTLLLQENQTLKRIPEAFFTSMGSLQLLDLHDTRIRSLPSSISILRKLKSLYLNDCTKLKELPSEIGELRSLEIFDLSRTGIQLFLSEIEKLTNLRCLRLSFEQDIMNSSHNHIKVQPMVEAPTYTISELAMLEESSICVDQGNKTSDDIVDTIVGQDVMNSSHKHIDVQLMVEAPSNTISELALLEESSLCVDQSNTKTDDIGDTIVKQDVMNGSNNHIDGLPMVEAQSNTVSKLVWLEESRTCVDQSNTKSDDTVDTVVQQHLINSSHNHIDVQPMAEAPSNTISALALLEELSICVDQSNTKWDDIVDTIVEQVAGLEELTALCFYFPKVNCLARFTETSKSWNRENEQGENTLGSGFRSFTIHVGYQQTKSSTILDKSECSAEKHLTFSGGDNMPNAVLQVLEQACTLELIGHQKVTNLSNFGAAKLRRLEICKVEECNKMESIFDGDLTNGFEVQCLKMLYIVKIPTLMHIWKGSMNPDSLAMLTKLVVNDCPRLKYIFSKESEMVLKLPKLQRLEVDNCIEMEEIIESGSAIERRVLEKLTSIDLRNLPNLKIICHSDVPLDWPSLEIIKIEGCQLLKELPLTTENASRLERIIMPDTLWNELNWPSDGVKQRFEDKFSHCSATSGR